MTTASYRTATTNVRQHRRTSSLPRFDEPPSFGCGQWNGSMGTYKMTLPGSQTPQIIQRMGEAKDTTGTGMTTARSGEIIPSGTIHRNESRVQNEIMSVTDNSRLYYPCENQTDVKIKSSQISTSPITPSNKNYLLGGSTSTPIHRHGNSDVKFKTSYANYGKQKGLADWDDGGISSWEDSFRKFDFNVSPSEKIMATDDWKKEFLNYHEKPVPRNRSNSGTYSQGADAPAKLSSSSSFQVRRGGTASKNIGNQRGYVSDSEDSWNWLEEQRTKLEKKRTGLQIMDRQRSEVEGRLNQQRSEVEGKLLARLKASQMNLSPQAPELDSMRYKARSMDNVTVAPEDYDVSYSKFGVSYQRKPPVGPSSTQNGSQRNWMGGSHSSEYSTSDRQKYQTLPTDARLQEFDSGMKRQPRTSSITQASETGSVYKLGSTEDGRNTKTLSVNQTGSQRTSRSNINANTFSKSMRTLRKPEVESEEEITLQPIGPGVQPLERPDSTFARLKQQSLQNALGREQSTGDVPGITLTPPTPGPHSVSSLSRSATLPHSFRHQLQQPVGILRTSVQSVSPPVTRLIDDDITVEQAIPSADTRLWNRTPIMYEKNSMQPFIPDGNQQQLRHIEYPNKPVNPSPPPQIQRKQDEQRNYQRKDFDHNIRTPGVNHALIPGLQGYPVVHQLDDSLSSPFQPGLTHIKSREIQSLSVESDPQQMQPRQAQHQLNNDDERQKYQLEQLLIDQQKQVQQLLEQQQREKQLLLQQLQYQQRLQQEQLEEQQFKQETLKQQDMLKQQQLQKLQMQQMQNMQWQQIQQHQLLKSPVQSVVGLPAISNSSRIPGNQLISNSNPPQNYSSISQFSNHSTANSSRKMPFEFSSQNQGNVAYNFQAASNNNLTRQQSDETPVSPTGTTSTGKYGLIAPECRMETVMPTYSSSDRNILGVNLPSSGTPGSGTAERRYLLKDGTDAVQKITTASASISEKQQGTQMIQNGSAVGGIGMNGAGGQGGISPEVYWIQPRPSDVQVVASNCSQLRSPALSSSGQFQDAACHRSFREISMTSSLDSCLTPLSVDVNRMRWTEGQSSPSFYADRSSGGSLSSSRDGACESSSIKFINDMSNQWYKSHLSREEVINTLKNKPVGSFLVRDSNTYPGSYALAMRVATIPANAPTKKNQEDPAEELVRHFLIEQTPTGVRLKGYKTESAFGSLAALIYQHSITPLSLPCRLLLPTSDSSNIFEIFHETERTPSSDQLVRCSSNILYITSIGVELLSGPEALDRATTIALDKASSIKTTIINFKVTPSGVTLTDNNRALFFRRHYPTELIRYCGLDRRLRSWTYLNECTGQIIKTKIFGIVSRKSGLGIENECHLFAELDATQTPASLIIQFVNQNIQEGGKGIGVGNRK